MILKNVFNYRKYVDFEKNCKIINSIPNLEKINSNFKCLVLNSNKEHIVEGKTFNLYDLNQEYIKDYEECKNHIEIKEYRSGEKVEVNPFHSVNLLLMLENEGKITFADKMDFCERTAIKHNFIEALKYHYIPEVIRKIENAINLKLDDIYKEFNKNIEFYFCNGHCIDEIKEGNVEDLSYEKAHDLANIENKKYNISAYLGVYDDEFQLTYCIHNKDDFENEFDNVMVDKLDISKIKDERDLEKTMINMLQNFYITQYEILNEEFNINTKNEEESEVI